MKITDKMRLDWLEDGNLSRWNKGGVCVETRHEPWIIGEGPTVRAAIDAAIFATKPSRRGKAR